MMRLPRPVSSLALVLSSVLGLALADSGPAEAGHGHFSGSVRIGGGGVRIRGGVSVRVGRPFGGRVFAGRPRVWVGGRWWWNGWYWPRPYYYYYSYPEYVPSYYGTYYPVQPGPGEGVAAPGAEGHDGGHVDLVEGREHGGGALSLEQALRNRLPPA